MPRARRRPRFTATTAFAYVLLPPNKDAAQDKAVAALEAAGEPVVRIVVNDKMQLGQEFFRWEMATAVAGAVIGINRSTSPMSRRKDRDPQVDRRVRENRKVPQKNRFSPPMG